MNDSEDSLMWGKYAQNCGLAIRTTVHELENSLELSDVAEFTTGCVVYGYVKLQPGEDVGDMFYFFTNKDPSYKNELEYRIAFKPHDLSKISGGLPIRADLLKLIKGITVSPKSPKWFLNLVQSVADKNGLKVRVSTSTLDRKPFE
jgi:hypothetical protein